MGAYCSDHWVGSVYWVHSDLVAHGLVPACLPVGRYCRRYYAVESLYNVAKSTRQSFLAVFPQTFDGLFHLCADSDANVQNATAFLDRLVKVTRLLSLLLLLLLLFFFVRMDTSLRQAGHPFPKPPLPPLLFYCRTLWLRAMTLAPPPL